MKQFKSYSVFIDGDALTKSKLAPRGASIGDWNSSASERISQLLAAANYEDKVVAILANLDRPGVGRIVLEALPQAKRAVVVPILARLESATGACAMPQDQAAAGPQRNGLPGAGSNALLPFNPEGGQACQANPQAGGCISMGRDELMLHELVHALRQMRGLWETIAVNAPDQAFDDSEEFYAIVLTNIFMSANGQTRLRKDHHDTTNPLPERWGDSAKFLSNPMNRRWTHALCTSELPDVALKVKELEAPFNPIREYMNNRQKYPLN